MKKRGRKKGSKNKVKIIPVPERNTREAKRVQALIKRDIQNTELAIGELQKAEACYTRDYNCEGKNCLKCENFISDEKAMAWALGYAVDILEKRLATLYRNYHTD